ncbi:MAG TPA: helix-turn-helix domain-containing protein [Pyrinomonadaceae bacterium]|nr:helix-turn-helix domain-containing protein [Pyrinomonadaceae bacterium]
MIKNERQYRIAKAQAAKFEDALKAFLAESRSDRTTHPRLIKAQKDAMQSQLESLRRELTEYEDLESGNMPPPDLEYISVVPRDLIRARIASGLSQKELAKRLGMPEQQIQRYEAKEYESVSLARISEVAKVLQSVSAKSSHVGNHRH